MSGLLREDNPRLVSRQEWWISFGHQATTDPFTPICTECADPMPDAPFVGTLVCEECLPFVPESERWL